MKKLVIIALLFISTIQSGFSQSAAKSAKGFARVGKMQGVEVYALCEPLREYEVLFDVVTGAKAASLLTGGVVNEGVSDKLSQFVNKALKEANKRKQTIDAIIYTDGKKVIAVKFKGQPTEKTKAIGTVSKIEGVEVFVMNEPLKDYETTVDVSTGLKAKSYITGGLVNNSIEEDIAQYVRRAVKEAGETNQKVDAVVYTGGKRAIGVKFN